MSHFEDEVQMEQLRRWWKENWVALAGGLVLGLGGIFGWEAWQNAKTSEAEQASQIYEDLKNAAAKPERVAELGKTLMQDFPATPYAAQAALLLAQKSAAAGDWAAAGVHLNWVIQHADDAGLKKLARLRLARALWQQNKPQDALAQLDVKDDDAFASLYQELRGDILLSQNDRAAARSAYEKALTLGPAPASREFLQRKLDDLAGVQS